MIMDEVRIENLIKNLIIEIGEDPTREGLHDTPKRIAKMYKEIFGGYESDPQLAVQFSVDSDTVIIRNIKFYSMCEHHMLPFYGKIHIAYSPNGRVFGVSKLIRLVEKYSRRLQIQERLTKNIADDLYSQGVKGVAIIAQAEHFCMKMRGVHSDAEMISSTFRGIFNKQVEKDSIISLIHNNTLNRGNL
ncbi:MAG: GTP cyclohydrolase I [Cenarchaeum symbiont of Oopsacas minuta]|nr:GTP cyclohydrolase I [Cenarchaeum symbiont of Oopsacas minuta]